jgi:hypothetical protein
MSLSYARLRQLHFRISLADQFRGMRRIVIILLGFLGATGLLAVAEMLTVLANGLMALTYPDTVPVERLGVVLSWQLLTLGLLWSLRRVMFMQGADSFLSVLPIPERAVWRADLLIAMQCYSIMWLPLGWSLYTLWRRLPPQQALLACMSYLVMIGSDLVLNLLLLRGMYRRAGMMALPMLALMVMRPQSAAGAGALLGVALLAVIAAVRMRPARPTASQPAGHGRACYERMAVVSALVLPVSLHALRESLIVRGASLLGAWAMAMALLAGRAPSMDLATALLIGLSAMASATLYRLPALIRSTVLSRLDFLVGHRRFRWRVTLFAAMLPTALFTICLGAAWATAIHALPVGASDAVLPFHLLYLYAGLFVLGALGATWPRDVMRWLIPAAHFSLTLVLLMATLT